MQSVTLPPLHAKQREIARSKARFKILSCGRRWGKTRLAALLAVYHAGRGKRGFWVAPTFPVALVGWRLLCLLARQFPGAEIRVAERLIMFPGGGWIQVKSADNPDSLRGEGLDFLIIDEAAFIQERAWTEALRPALSDRRGWALFCSTPAGRNWYWRLFQRGVKVLGKEDEFPDYHSWQMPSASNPYFPAGEIDEAKKSVSDRVFRQEFLAEFLEMAGAIFTGIEKCLYPIEELRDFDPLTDSAATFVAGIDWGRTGDYTAIVIMDSATQRVRWVERFTGIDFDVQKARVEGTLKRWRVKATLGEHNSFGGPLITDLQRRGIPIQPFVTTNATKAALFDGLALSFAHGNIKLPNDPILTGELYSIEATKLPSGVLRYAAPDGSHDDTVIALGLALEAAKSGLVERGPGFW